MLVLDGISLASAELDIDGNRYDTGWVHAWTGRNAVFNGTQTTSQGASLDQLVAAELARTDRLSPIRGERRTERCSIAHGSMGMAPPPRLRRTGSGNASLGPC